jgi:uncharacterized protein
MIIGTYPRFKDIDLSMRPLLHPGLANLEAGISEFCFAGLYLFRHTYNYQVAWLPGKNQQLILRGQKQGQTFYCFPQGLPKDKTLLQELLDGVDFFKNLSVPQVDGVRIWAEQVEATVVEDRDNFDYLYLR